MYQRDHERERALHGEAATDVAHPGRDATSASLEAPKHPIPSGIVMRKGDHGVQAGAEDALASAASSSGAPLPETVMRKFEGSLGADLSGVRVHTGAESSAAATAVGARAYAVGQDIHFNAGQYDPSSTAGQHLLAHEVAHTVQQRGGTPARQNKLEVSSPHDAAEHAADRAADAMVAGRSWSLDGIGVALHRSLDDQMKESEDKLSKHLDTSQRRIEIIGGHSMVGDSREAETIIGKIDGQEAGLVKAAGEYFNRGIYDNCLKDNVSTRFALQQYVDFLGQSGNALDNFKPAYESLRADYGGLVGLAVGFTTGKDGVALEGTAMEVVDAATLKLQHEGANTSKGVEMLKGNRKFGDNMKGLEAARGKLETARMAVVQQTPAVNAAADNLRAKNLRVQAAAAKAKADKKKTELASLQSKIGAVASGIATAVELSGKLATAVQASEATVKEHHFVTGFQQTGDRLKATQGTTLITAEPGKSQGDKLAALGKDLASGNIKEVAQQVIEVALAGAISELTAAIAAADEEQNLADAAAEAADLDALKSKLASATIAAANLLDIFYKAKAEVTRLVDELATQASQAGNPTAAAALRFIGGADKFLAQADLAISMGEEQQAKGAKALDERKKINRDGESFKGKMQWWEAVQNKGDWSLRSLLSDERKPTEWAAVKNTVEMKNAGNEGLLDGNGNNGTQFDVGGAIGEIKNNQKPTIEKLRAAAQKTVGMNAPSGNAAITPSAG